MWFGIIFMWAGLCGYLSTLTSLCGEYDMGCLSCGVLWRKIFSLVAMFIGVILLVF